jgi:hypothetical protein
MSMQSQYQINYELICNAARRGATSIESVIRNGIDINEVDSVMAQTIQTLNTFISMHTYLIIYVNYSFTTLICITHILLHNRTIALPSSMHLMEVM